MNRNRVTFEDGCYRTLASLMAVGEPNESAAFLLCAEVITEMGITLIVRDVLPIQSSDILSATPHEMQISSRAVVRALKAADDGQYSFVFIHSHPSGCAEFSTKDDKEEEKLFSTAHIRVSGVKYHGSLIWSDGRITDGRVWDEFLISRPLHHVNVIGQRFTFYALRGEGPVAVDMFNRQTMAFGSEVQTSLQSLQIGVVGLGGTGSAILEQIVRLGVGSVLLYDPDKFEKTNVNRVYGSQLGDQDLPKVQIAERLVRSIGLGTRILTYEADIAREDVAKTLRNCDVIFGCTDDELGRSVLARLAVAYAIPVFDMGVKIDPEGDSIRSIEARVTTLIPGEACLLCRGRISGPGIAGDAIRKFQPELAPRLEREGYLGGAGGPAPAVIAFTTATAAAAVTEFLHRLTGMMGADRVSSELLFFIKDSRLRTNRKERRPGCFCADPAFIGSGDRKPFLDMVWPK